MTPRQKLDALLRLRQALSRGVDPYNTAPPVPNVWVFEPVKVERLPSLLRRQAN